MESISGFLSAYARASDGDSCCLLTSSVRALDLRRNSLGADGWPHVASKRNRYGGRALTLLLLLAAGVAVHSGVADAAPPATYLAGLRTAGAAWELVLVDPTDATSVVSLASSGNPFFSGQFTGLIAGSFTPPYTFTDRHIPAMVFVKDNRIYKVSLLRTDAPTPVQISSEGDAGKICGFYNSNALVGPTERLVYYVTGPDGQCMYPDWQSKMIRLDMAPSEAPIPAGRVVAGLVDENYNQTGWLSVDTGNVLKHYDVDFGTSSVVTAFGNDVLPLAHTNDNSVILLRIDNDLRAYNQVTKVLTNSLYHFTSSSVLSAGAWQDASFAYIDDDNFNSTDIASSTFKIVRVPLNGNSAAVTLASENGWFDGMWITSERIVYQVRTGRPLLTSYAIKSVAKGGGAPIGLLAGVDDGASTRVVVTSENIVYANVGSPGGSGFSALSVRDDGTGAVSVANANWIGYTSRTSCDSMPACDNWPENLLRTEGPALTTTSFGGTLKSFSATTSSEIAVLGTLPPDEFFSVASGNAPTGTGIGDVALLNGLSLLSETVPTPMDLFSFDAGVSGSLMKVGASGSVTPAAINFQGLWWNAPAGSESGWGINFAHQGDVIFATWFTYDTTGKAWWLGMQANRTATGVYAGTIFTTHGPAFNALPFDPSKVTETTVGSGTLTFTDANDATFAYTVNGVTQTKTLTREVFGASVPVCTFGGTLPAAQATNYQDLWWASPAGSESGWGVNLTHQGEVIFATWFTYDANGNPLWLSGPATKTGPGVYTGALAQTTGPAFNAVPFDPTRVIETPVGTLTLTFSDGANGTFAYTVNGVSQAKAITREVFVSPGTVCQ